MLSRDEERARNTTYARRRRRKKIDAQNADRTRCAAMLGRGKPCQTPLQSRFVDGETVPFCPTCDLKERGICIDCRSQPVDGAPRKALRCAACKRLAYAASMARYRVRNASKLRKKEAQRLADPEKHRDRLEYKRLYRRSRPKKVAEEKRRDYERHRERYLEYHRLYRETRRAERAAVERARHAGTLPARQCLSCPTLVSGRMKRCEACRAESRRSAREAIARRLAQREETSA